VEYARLETDTLAHVDDTYYYGAYCRKCGHHARLSLVKLRQHLGDNFRLAEIRHRLKCEKCGDRNQISVTFLSPAQRSGNLIHLFARKPRN